MPTRFCLCLLIAFASATVAAREVKLSSPNSGSCPDQAAEAELTPKQKAQPARATTPVRESRPRAVLHSDSVPRPSLRWHSFLPGMFR